MTTVTQALYDRSAASWVRRSPTSLSDFTARPAVLSLCDPVAGVKVLDLGCGEGYPTRELRRRGAAEVHGMDISEEMIRAAAQQEQLEPLGITYSQGSATDLSRFGDGELDLVLAVFLFNYLTVAQSRQCMREVKRVLRRGGRFVYSVPHPAFAFLRGEEPPFYFAVGGASYFSARDSLFPGRIWKIDGDHLDVQLVHKTFEDYFSSMSDAGFDAMPEIRELRVTPELVSQRPSFFGPLLGIPLHLAVRVEA